MLHKLIANCRCALTGESADYRELLKDFDGRKSCVIGFMPAVTDDLFPVFALSCTSASQIISPDIYIIPVGANDYWAKSQFEEIVNRFYQLDEFQEQFDIEFEEMLLLVNPELKCFFTLYDGTDYNVAVWRITLPNGLERYLVVVPLTPDNCWKEIVEPYDVKCCVLIDSNKGMGNWFDAVPLYRVMRETSKTELLPQYYFKGMFISHDAPFGFKLVYTIPDRIIRQGRIVDKWQKEIYAIDWNENKKST